MPRSPLKQIRFPRIVTVSPDGSADHKTIQAAHNAAAEDTAIFVYPGNYPEQLTWSKRIHLIGVGHGRGSALAGGVVQIDPALTAGGNVITMTSPLATGSVFSNFRIHSLWSAATGTGIGILREQGGDLWLDNIRIDMQTAAGAGPGGILRALDVRTDFYATNCRFRVFDFSNRMSTGDKRTVRLRPTVAAVEQTLHNVHIDAGDNAPGDLFTDPATPIGLVRLGACVIDGTSDNLLGAPIEEFSGNDINVRLGVHTIKYVTVPDFENENNILANQVFS